MSDTQQPPEADALKAPVKRRKWFFPVVWVVPVVAAILAGYLLYDRAREYGPTITIRFKEVSGVRAGQTEVRYRGMVIGQVTAAELSKDQQHVVVEVRLRRSVGSIAREGTTFWIVRPEVNIGSITGLATVITGPYIELSPGPGKPKAEFVGLESPPVLTREERKGLKIMLLSSHLGGLKLNSPVFYRGVEVGLVEDFDLRADATMAEIHVFIRQRYARLVRTGSKFWEASGLDVRFGLRRGLEINMESLKSLVGGGIAFATPEDPESKPVRNGTVFPLFDQPNKEWLEWMPKIPIPPEQ